MCIEFKHNSLSKKITDLLPNLEMATKTLKLQSVSKKTNARKLVISTNWLDVFGFNKGTDVIEDVVGRNQGIEVLKASISDTKTKKVYSRSYKNRGDETQMDIRSQAKLNMGLGDAVEAHIVFTKNKLSISPIFAPENRAIASGLNITLGEKGISFTAIIDALNTIRDKKFAKLVVEADESYKNSQEFTIFLMSIRRMGYSLEKTASGSLVAVLGDGAVASMADYKHFPTFTNTPPKFDHKNPLGTFSVCTSGVDVYGIEKEGFNVSAALDYRPIEERDVKKTACPETGIITRKLKSDKTEAGAICTAINAKSLKLIINEDIYKAILNQSTTKYLKNISFFQASLQCCDFSAMKNKADRERHIQDLSSTRDMIIPMLQIIEHINPATALIENVVPFAKSDECALFVDRLRMVGYTVSVKVLAAEDFNGYTKRPRCYIFATKLESSFNWPTPVKRTSHVWNDIIEPNQHLMRDITHSKSVQKGIAIGRIRPIKQGSHVAPTVVKSASRVTKDGVYPKIGDRYFMPNNDMFKMMMGIDEGFDLSLFSQETGTEFIGQSVCLNLHKHIATSIKKHILEFAYKNLSNAKNTLMFNQLAPLPL